MGRDSKNNAFMHKNITESKMLTFKNMPRMAYGVTLMILTLAFYCRYTYPCKKNFN